MTNIGSPAISNMMQYGTRNAPGGEKVGKNGETVLRLLQKQYMFEGSEVSSSKRFFSQKFMSMGVLIR